MTRLVLAVLFSICSGFWAGLASAQSAPAPAAGVESAGFRAEFFEDLDGLERRVVSLADAIPQEKYNWRPAEGVRSIHEVLLHIATTNYTFPRMAGIQPPPGVDLKALLSLPVDKAKVREVLVASFAHAREGVRGLAESDMERKAQGMWTVRRTLVFQLRHASEHLGQLIAYARVNGITPPWTEEQQRRGASSNPSAPGYLATNRTLAWNAGTRTYSLFVPATPQPKPLPVVLLHHGTGGDGAAMVEAWRGLALEEKVILVAPDGLGKYGWSVPDDGPGLQQEILAALQSEYRIDPSRVYLFGYSAGGDFVFYAALQQSRYFAAVCVHEAALRPRQFAMLDLAERKIPVYYSVGTADSRYPVAETQATRKALNQRKWPLKMVERPIGHIYQPAEVNPACWEFLKKHRLRAPPAKTPLSDEWLSHSLR